MNNSNPGPKRLNVLVLDGGGVRGLSSLLILEALMVQVNQHLTNCGQAFGELHPHHVFKLVAGTSTGGLIALMLGKMGLTVKECITQYEKLSRVVFGKKHFRGRITRGLAPAKYSGKRLRNCIRRLLCERQLDENLLMGHEADRVACAVVCREHCSSSQYSKLKKKAVPICSLPCKDNFVCKVCDAARATSAAPTFFPVMRIDDRYFADGGLDNNNPSFAIYFHYSQAERKKSTRPKGSSAGPAPEFSPHGDLDCSCVRFTNIGTGAKVDDVEPGKRDRLADLVPGVIRKGVFLKQTLTDIAVSAEKYAEMMRQFQVLNPKHIMYERFDANHGVSNIKLDDYKALGEIREKTGQYLEEQETKDLLEEVGKDIATDYLKSRGILNNLAIDNSHQPLNSSIILSASDSQLSGSSSHSNYLDSEPQVLLPKHDNFPKLTEHRGETILPPDGQGHSEQYSHGNSGMDTMESGTPMVAAEA